MIVILSTIVILLLFYLISNIPTKKNLRTRYYVPKKVKKAFKKISVPTNKIAILSSQYLQEKSKRPVVADSDFYPLSHPSSVENEMRNASVLTYNVYINNKDYTFKSSTIYLGSLELKEIFKNTSSIDIYYNELNLDDHYFDLNKFFRYFPNE